MFKTIKGLSPLYLQNLFSTAVHRIIPKEFRDQTGLAKATHDLSQAQLWLQRGAIMEQSTRQFTENRLSWSLQKGN